MELDILAQVYLKRKRFGIYHIIHNECDMVINVIFLILQIRIVKNTLRLKRHIFNHYYALFQPFMLDEKMQE